MTKHDPEIKAAEATAHTTIYAALAAAQMEMGRALKSASNRHFKSKYADLSSVVDACMPALNSHGIAVYQPTGTEGGAHFVETILAHESGQMISCRVPLIIGKNDMQGYGSAVTYARRYGLMGMAGIAPEDDDGNAAEDDDGNAAASAAPNKQDLFEADVSQAIRGIQRETDMDGLAAMFGDLYRRNRPVADDPRVMKAKDARKVDLAPKANADLDQDEIPY